MTNHLNLTGIETTELLNQYSYQQTEILRKLYEGYSKQPLNEEGPIRNEKDRLVLQRMIVENTKTPNNVQICYEFESDKTIVVHTLGLWLFCGLPELVFNIDTNSLNAIKNNYSDGVIDRIEFFVKYAISVHVSNNLPKLKNQLYVENEIIKLEENYDFSDVILDVLGIKLMFSKVPEDMYINHPHIMWFYTYFKQAKATRNIIVSKDDKKIIEKDDGLEYQLYPILETAFDIDEITNPTSEISIVYNTYFSIVNNLNREEWSDDTYSSSEQSNESDDK